MFTPISVKTKTFAPKRKTEIFRCTAIYKLAYIVFRMLLKITYLKKPRFQYFKTCVYPYLMYETTSI